MHQPKQGRRLDTHQGEYYPRTKDSNPNRNSIANHQPIRLEPKMIYRFDYEVNKKQKDQATWWCLFEVHPEAWLWFWNRPVHFVFQAHNLRHLRLWALCQPKTHGYPVWREELQWTMFELQPFWRGKYPGLQERVDCQNWRKGNRYAWNQEEYYRAFLRNLGLFWFYYLNNLICQLPLFLNMLC